MEASPPPAGNTAVSVNLSTLRAELAKREAPADTNSAILIEPIAEGALLPTGVNSAVTLAQHFQEHADHRIQFNYSFGFSLERYGDLVASGLRSAVAGEGVQGVPPSVSQWSIPLGQWLRDGFTGGRSARSRDIVLTAGELQYFFFSSSARATLIAQTLKGLTRGGEITCFIDHGAAIGFVPLVVNSLVPVRSVACSEIKKEYVVAGRSLWKSLGMDDRIQFQQCSSVDFVYPPDGATVVFFGQMLFRIPPANRKAVLRAAIDALTPGGVLIVNEIMDRPELGATYRAPMVASAELLDYLSGPDPICVVRSPSESSKPVPVRSAAVEGFKNSNNLVLLVKR